MSALPISTPAPARPPLATPAPGQAARLALLYIGGMCVLLPVFLLFATERYSYLARLLAWLGLGLALLPGTMMLVRPASRMNSLAVTGLALGTYCLAVFHESRIKVRWGEARLSEDSVDLALLVTALAMPLMWAGWAVGGALGLRRIVPRPGLQVPRRALRWGGVGLVLFSLLLNALFLRGDVDASGPRTASLAAVLSQPELGFAMILVSQLAGGGTPRGGRLFWGLWLLVLLHGMVAGVLLVIIRPLLVYLFAMLYVRRRVRLLPLGVVAVVVLLAQPVKGEYRHRVWDRSGPMELGLTDRALLFGELLVQHWLPGEFDAQLDAGSSVQTAVARTGSAISLAHVIEMTPSVIPYQYGRTLSYFLYALVPRIVYPDKPSPQAADIWYAHAYGYLYEREQSHVIMGMPQIAEGYINFGLIGGLLLLMAVGLLYRAVDESFGRGDIGLGGLALYLTHVSHLMTNSQEGSLGQAWGGVLQFFLFYSFVLTVIGRLGRQTS